MMQTDLRMRASRMNVSISLSYPKHVTGCIKRPRIPQTALFSIEDERSENRPVILLDCRTKHNICTAPSASQLWSRSQTAIVKKTLQFKPMPVGRKSSQFALVF
jgi:hypothetical protein